MNEFSILITSTRAVIVVVSFGFIYDRSRKFFQKRERQTLIKYATSMFVWLGILSFTIYNPLFSENDFGSLLIFYILIISIILIFKLLNMIERIEDKITQIVRHQALSDLKKKRRG